MNTYNNIKEVNDICIIDPRDRREIIKMFAQGAEENLRSQLKELLDKDPCPDEEVVCVIDGIMKGVLVVARDYKKKVKAKKVKAQVLAKAYLLN